MHLKAIRRGTKGDPRLQKWGLGIGGGTMMMEAARPGRYAAYRRESEDSPPPQTVQSVETQGKLSSLKGTCKKLL